MHLAIIPDGNRRFAKKYGISLAEAYKRGLEKGIDVVKWAFEKGFNTITLYALSTENLQRNKDQLNLLFLLYKQYMEKLLKSDELQRWQAKIRVVGTKIPEQLQDIVKRLHGATKHFTKRIVYVCLGYGGRDEIREAAKKGKIEEHLLIKEPVDLIIRTGGFQRLSNFLLWQSAYAELYFSPKLWPEFDREEFEKAIAWYNSQERKFGR